MNKTIIYNQKYKEWSKKKNNKETKLKNYLKTKNISLEKEYFLYKNSKWIIDKFLGKGGFGNVFITYEKKNPNEKFVVKIQTTTKEAIKEYNFFSNKKYNKNFIVNFYFGIIEQLYIYLIFEKLQKYKPTLETFPYLIKTLEYLAKIKQISHGDIKFTNIMSRQNNKPILIDFGLNMPISLKKQKISGTLNYMSENAHEGIVTYKNDLESLCYCILNIYNTLPWQKKYDENIIMNLKKKFKKDFITTNGNCFDEKNILYKKLKTFIIKVFEIENNSIEFPEYNTLINIVKNIN